MLDIANMGEVNMPAKIVVQGIVIMENINANAKNADVFTRN